MFASAKESAAEAASEAPSSKILLAFCSCGNQLGLFNVAAASVTLFKWQVDCETVVKSKRPDSSDCLAAMLLTTLSRYGSSKSVVVPTVRWERPERPGQGLGDRALPSDRVLHIWILNNKIKYSSTSAAAAPGRTAIKLLYRIISVAEADKMLESLTSEVQEVNLPREAMNDAWKRLQESNALLPVNERLFQNSNVGLLDRWEST